MLNEGGRQFGPLHNLAMLCLDQWRTPFQISALTSIPEDTVRFVLYDLRSAALVAERADNGGQYRQIPPRKPDRPAAAPGKGRRPRKAAAAPKAQRTGRLARKPGAPR